MPDAIAPMLARLGELPPERQDADFGYEVKWDGVRAAGPRGRRAPDAHGTQRDRLHPALPRAARDGGGARVAPGDPRRRGGGPRLRRAPELRAPPGQDAPGLGLGGAPAPEGHTRDLRGLRPALGRRPFAHRPRLLRAAPAAGRPGARGARAGGPRRTARATARPCWRRAGSRSWRASWPSAWTPRTSRGRRSSAWIKVKNHGAQDVVVGGYTRGEGGRSQQPGRAVRRRVRRGRTAPATRARWARGSPRPPSRS